MLWYMWRHTCINFHKSLQGLIFETGWETNRYNTPCVALCLVVRSPFRVKHHVVVQYMARWMKCPLPPSPPLPLPQPTPPLPTPCQSPPCWNPPAEKTRTTRKNQWHYFQGTLHCSCLEHCFLFLKLYNPQTKWMNCDASDMILQIILPLFIPPVVGQSQFGHQTISSFFFDVVSVYFCSFLCRDRTFLCRTGVAMTISTWCFPTQSIFNMQDTLHPLGDI